MDSEFIIRDVYTQLWPALATHFNEMNNHFDIIIA